MEVRKIVKQSFEAELGLYHLSALSSVCTEDMYPRGVVLIQILLHEGNLSSQIIKPPFIEDH